jgi:hypothetical protein
MEVSRALDGLSTFVFLLSIFSVFFFLILRLVDRKTTAFLEAFGAERGRSLATPRGASSKVVLLHPTRGVCSSRVCTHRKKESGVRLRFLRRRVSIYKTLPNRAPEEVIFIGRSKNGSRRAAPAGPLRHQLPVGRDDFQDGEGPREGAHSSYGLEARPTPPTHTHATEPPPHNSNTPRSFFLPTKFSKGHISHAWVGGGFPPLRGVDQWRATPPHDVANPASVLCPPHKHTPLWFSSPKFYRKCQILSPLTFAHPRHRKQPTERRGEARGGALHVGIKLTHNP